jgi:hypothetical protein
MLVDILEIEKIEKDNPFGAIDDIHFSLNKLVKARKEEGYNLLHQSMNDKYVILTWKYEG